MRATPEIWDDREVERVAHRRLERADAALAENDVLVAARHDVLGAHKEFLQRRGHATLQKNWLLRVGTNFLKEIEVLHVPRANLDHVDVVEEVDVLEVHKLGDDRKPRLALRSEEHVEPGLAEALERVRGGARLERAAA